ncbi:MAG TPA: DUF2911 domain-containing protein [Gemmatimonadales bacterium]|jgi:hypothetical protein
MFMPVAILAILMHAASTAELQQPVAASFVTTLGHDTIAVETYHRNGTRLDGDIVLRAPQTVRYHYAVTMRPDGTVARAVTDFSIPANANAPRNRTTITFAKDSATVDVDTAGIIGTVKRSAPYGTAPELMSGFASDYGLYISLGLYEPIIARLKTPIGDTTRVPIIGAVGGQRDTKFLVRRSPALVDVDYFKSPLWTHLAVNSAGVIDGADATQTTEKTRSVRTGPINIDSVAKDFLRRDHAGKAFGVSSPAAIARGKIGDATVTINYNSPRKRGREILGATVPYDQVWRTGADAATVLTTDHAITIGGHQLAAGKYTLWTKPSRTGALLVINAQVGQWGTDYDSGKDIVRLPMKAERVPTAENFAITVSGSGNKGELQMAWDDFRWSIPVSAP